MDSTFSVRGLFANGARIGISEITREADKREVPRAALLQELDTLELSRVITREGTGDRKRYVLQAG